MSLARVHVGSTKSLVALLGSALCACHDGRIVGPFERDCATPSACSSERASDGSVFERTQDDSEEGAREPVDGGSGDARADEDSGRTRDASITDAGARPHSDASGGAGDTGPVRADATVEDAGQRGDAGHAGPPFPTGIAAGAFHSCAVFSDGSGRCWGYNDFGQLGNGTTSSTSICLNNTATVNCSRRPLPVLGLAQAASISLGDNHSCAVLSGGALQCWGLNDNGQLGLGSNAGPSRCLSGQFPCATEPVLVSALPRVRSVKASFEAHTCALLYDGTVRCWGLNSGQLALASGPSMCTQGQITLSCATAPLSVMGVADAIALDSCSFQTCAVLSDGSARCWGSNISGQLGTMTTSSALTPTRVQVLNSARSIATGGMHTCALDAERSVWCWGGNSLGQLGTPIAATTPGCEGSTVPPFDIPCSRIPLRIPSLAQVSALSAGGNHTCALLENGTVRCWGQNDHGQLGLGSTIGPSTCHVGFAATPSACSAEPTQVPGLSGITAIACGATHTCAVSSSREVYCWGYNVFGQLGNDTALDSASPVRVQF